MVADGAGRNQHYLWRVGASHPGHGLAICASRSDGLGDGHLDARSQNLDTVARQRISGSIAHGSGHDRRAHVVGHQLGGRDLDGRQEAVHGIVTKVDNEGCSPIGIYGNGIGGGGGIADRIDLFDQVGRGRERGEVNVVYARPTVPGCVGIATEAQLDGLVTKGGDAQVRRLPTLGSLAIDCAQLGRGGIAGAA